MLSSPSPGNSNQENPDPLQTPAPKKKKEDYVDYDLSPPKLPEKKRRAFEEAVAAIQRDFKTIKITEEQDENGNATGKLLWSYADGRGVYPHLACRILLFLYSRKFMMNMDRQLRKAGVRAMLKTGRVRAIIKQVIDCTGDKNLSSNKEYRNHYIRACLTLHRYFVRSRVFGFLVDRPDMIHYLRMQKFGSCFLQAACVAMSYLLQCFGRNVAPPNASRLIRHHFKDDQLTKYVVDDLGGDSVAIFKILEKKFFDCDECNRNLLIHNVAGLNRDSHRTAAIEDLQLGPLLVSKFAVPLKFECKPPSDDVRNQFPRLDVFLKEMEETRSNPGQGLEKEEKEDAEEEENSKIDVWQKIPSNLIPPGVTRFETWNQPGEFIPFGCHIDEKLSIDEESLKTKWMELLNQPTEEDDRSTAVTASTEVDSSYERSSTLSERSNSAFMDDSSFGEDWLPILFGGEEDDDSSIGSYGTDGEGDVEPGEGDNEAPFHAMVLLGRLEENGTDYWVVQNSWAGPMQILEFSTEYFKKSGAYLYFFDRNRQLKPEDQWNIKNLNSFCCSSPVAESASLERNDCEHWPDEIVHSTSQQQDDVDFDDIMKTF